MKFSIQHTLLLLFSFAFLSVATLVDVTAFEYKKDILPILKDHCYQCHTGPKAKRENRPLYDEENFPQLIGTHPKALIVPGQPDKSEVIRRIYLPATDTDSMPPSGRSKPLNTAQRAMLKKWIEDGALLGVGDATTPPTPPTSADPDKVYTWSSDSGSTLEAVFVSVDESNVSLRRADNGMIIKIPKNRLSVESQKLAEQFER